MILLRDLKDGDWFAFAKHPEYVYRYQGNGWYGRPYSGGPWHTLENPRVFLCSLEHSENLEAAQA